MTQAPLSVLCPRCAAVLPPTANFCRRCGIGLTRPPLPVSVRVGPLATPPQVRRASTIRLSVTKPAKKCGSGVGYLPVLVLCLVGMNAFRAYERSTSYRPAVLPSPRYFAPPSHFYLPMPPHRVAPPTPPAPPSSAVNGMRPTSVDELHWPPSAWPPRPAVRETDPWHVISGKSRSGERDR